MSAEVKTDGALVAELGRIVRGVHFEAADTIRIGDAVHTLSQAVTPMGMTASGDPLLDLLQWRLYDAAYCRRFGEAPAAVEAAPGAEDDLTEELSAANTGRDRWDSGWRVREVLPDGRFSLEKGGVQRRAWAGEFVSRERPGAHPHPGSAVDLYMPREARAMQPGFYFALGETLGAELEDVLFVRFYWNLLAEGAASLTREITSSLNRFVVPFRFKCLTSRAQYQRADAAVLYVESRHFELVSGLLAPIHSRLVRHLRPPTCLFAKGVAAGLGYAEDPAINESFGMNRCRALASGILSAQRKGLTQDDARLAEVVAVMEAAGVDLARPHLNPLTRVDFTLPFDSPWASR